MNKTLKQEVIELLGFGFDVQDFFNTALADKKITIAETLQGAFRISGSAQLGLDMPEDPISMWRKLSDEERAEVLNFARQRFDLNDDILELLIEDTLTEVAGDINVAIRWKKYIDRQTPASA